MMLPSANNDIEVALLPAQDWYYVSDESAEGFSFGSTIFFHRWSTGSGILLKAARTDCFCILHCLFDQLLLRPQG